MGNVYVVLLVTPPSLLLKMVSYPSVFLSFCRLTLMLSDKWSNLGQACSIEETVKTLWKKRISRMRKTSVEDKENIKTWNSMSHVWSPIIIMYLKTWESLFRPCQLKLHKWIVFGIKYWNLPSQWMQYISRYFIYWKLLLNAYLPSFFNVSWVKGKG